MKINITKWLLVAMIFFVGCQGRQSETVLDVPPSNNPNVPSSPPTELEIARACVQSSVQNSLSYIYSDTGSQPLTIVFVANAFPLTATHYFSSGNTYFEGSSFTIQIIHHAMGGDIELANETILDDHTAEFYFDAFTSPMYIATAGDSFTVNVTSNIEIDVDGNLQTYPQHIESFEFTLDDPVPVFNQPIPGELRQYDGDLECLIYFNPIFFLSSEASGTPDEFDISINALLTTYPLDPFFIASQKASSPVSFERSFSAILKNQMGVNVAVFNLSQPDLTSDTYATPSGELSGSVPAGHYTLELTSTVSADFGSGLLSSEVVSSFEIEIQAVTGDLLLNGTEYNGKQATEFGLALFE